MPDEGRVQAGWVKPKHSCMDEYNRIPFRQEPHSGSVWRCQCGKAWRIFGVVTWRLRRYDDKTTPARGSL